MKCLRCGTELKDSGVFCTECSKVTAVPLPASRYMSRKIILPKRKAPQPMKSPEAKVSEKKAPHSGKWIMTSVILLFLCAALILQGAYIYREKEQLATELERLHSVEDECVRLTDKLRQAEDTAAALEEELSNLGSDAYLAVRENLKAAKEENNRLIQELTRTQDNIRNLESQLELLREKTAFFDTYIVFVQDDGATVFHNYDCEKFIHQGYRVYNKQQAVNFGYTPCPHCQ